MPTSLTDQLYNTEQSNKPLTDQLSQNEQSKKSLTDQLYDTEIDSKKTTEPIVEQSVDYPAFFNPFFVTTPSARPESIRGDENQFPVNIPEKDREMYERQKRINESLATAEEWSKNKAEKINRITYISPYGEKQEKNESLIRKGLSKLNDWFGTDIKTKLSDEVKAQNVVKYMADEAKMPLYEYRQAPLFIEQAAQGYMSAIPFYTDIQKELTGEEPWPAEHPLDKTGHIGGFLFGLFTSLGPVMGQAISPITKYIPAVYDTDPIAKRILHTSLRDSINFGATMGLLSTGDASHKSTFSEAAPVIWDGVKTGVYYANFFAIAKGAFPNDPQVFARTLTGLIGLNAYRVKQLGVSEYTNRPWEDHIIDALTDVAFLFHGLPKSPLETFNKEVSENFKSATEIDQKKSMIETIPDEGIRKAQEEILKNKDIQLSMRIDQMIDKVVANLNSNNEIKIKGQELEVVKVKAARKISKKEVIKPEIVEPKKEVIKLEELKEPEESIKQVNKIIKPSESPELSKSIASELGIIYDGEMEWKPGKPFYSWSDPETGKSFTTLTTNKADVEDKLLNIKIQNNTIEDPIKVDLQTSNMSVDDFSTDNNPLRNTDSVFTSSQKKLYAEKTHIGNNPTILVSKFLNDVNCWLNGDNSIDIEMLKKEFSKYTSSIIDPRNRNSLVEFFGVFSEADNFIESAKDMNSWVSKASRSTKPVELGKVNKSEDSEILEDLVRIKTIEDYYGKKINDISDKELEDFFSKDSDKIDWFGEGDTKDNSIKLNFMIPLDEMPKEVAKFLGDTKGLVSKIVKRIGKIPAEPLFRNEKLFDETGYWLGKDGMWRYELSPDKFRFNVNKLLANKDIEYKMPDIVQYTSSRSQDIYSNIEELNDVKIILSNKFMGSQYDPIKNTIEILLSEDFTNKTIIRDLIHEVKHAINHFTNSPFLGTSMGHFFTPMFTKEASEYIYDLQRSGKISIEKARNFRQLLIDKDFYEAYIELIHSLPNKETKNIIAIKDKLYAKAFAEYWKDQGEMESRLEEKRFEMTKEERIKERPWETLDKMLDMESLDKDTIPTKISKEHGHTLYSGIDINEAVKQIKGIVTEANKFFEEFHKSKKEKKFDLFYAAKQLKIDTVRAFIEQSESLMKKTIDLFGEEGYKVVQRQRAAATGGGYGKFKYEQIVEDVYEGKSNKQIDAINAYILARRFKDIYGYKSEKTYKHQSGYGATESISATSIIEILKDLSPEALGKLSKKMPELTKYLGDLTPDQFKDIIKSGESYFNHIREVVDDLVKEGIKTVEEGEALKAHDFTKFKSLTIESLFDSRYKIRLGNDTIKVTSSGIESLGSGSHNILEMDARATLSEFTGRSYGIIANNEALRAWKGLAEKNPDNIIVSDKHKSGWSPIPFFDGGKRKNLYFHPDVSKYLMNRSHDVSKRFSQICQWSMLSPVTRSLAIGLSPVWSTFAGLPMDVVHTLFSARTYDPIVGKYKAIYNAFDPIYPLRLGVDMKRTLVDVYTRGELFKDYMRYGGSMPFLAMRQSRYMKGTHSPSEWAKLLDLLSYHGRSMELWVRVATADRVIRNRAKQLNITYEEARKNPDVMYEAVHTARDRMDYNQGGWFIKALDQCGFNFLNASVVGTRTFWRNAIDNPVDFTAKTIQIGVVSAGIAATGWLLYPNVMKEIPDEGNENNITWPLFPNWLVVKDKNGDDRHFYAKLRVDPGAAFMNKFFNGVTETYLYDKGLIKEEPNYKKLVKQLKALGPIGMSLPPSLQLWHDYSTNYSWWKDRQIYTEAGGRTFNWPDSKNEGVYDYKKGLRDPSISQLSTDIGQISGLSPKRLQETIGNVIPRGNEFVYLFGKSYEEAFSDLSNEVKNQHWLLSLAEIPGINKIIGVTRPGYNRNEEITKESDKELLESVIRNGKLDFLASSYYWYKAGKYEDMIDYVENFKDIDVKHNLIDRMKFIEKTKDLTHRNLWLRLYHMSPEAKAKDFRSALTKADEKEKTELWNDYSKLSSIGGYITQDFRDEYKKLVK